MAEDIYRELQRRLDTYSLGFPATESGVEIQILKGLFTDEDAAMFLELTPRLESAESVAERLGRSADEVADKLEDMSGRGLLFRLAREGSVRYGAIPFVHGIFEFQVSNLGRELSEQVEQYFKEEFQDTMIEGAAAFLRTVPVHASIDSEQNIASFDDACEILRKTEKIVVAECICRKQKIVVDQGCDKPIEACFLFGSMGQYYVDRDMGRRIDSDEAIRLLTEAQEAGLVTQPATAQNPGGMCNCCGDCCGVLRSLNNHPKPAEVVFSNHQASIDAGACTGCEICLERCQMRAIKMDDDVAEIDLDRCIGCGLCVTTCPAEALKLDPKPEDELRTPPPNTFEQMMFMAEKRGITF